MFNVVTQLATKYPVCGAKSHLVGVRRTSPTAHAITSQSSCKTCGHLWIATLTAARVHPPQRASADQTEPTQARSSDTPSRASQRRKRRLLAKDKGKMPTAAQ